MLTGASALRRSQRLAWFGVALTILVVGAFTWWRWHRTEVVRVAVARVCGVPERIVRWPHPVVDNGHQVLRIDVDTATLHLHFAHAWAIYDPATGIVDCRVG